MSSLVTIPVAPGVPAQDVTVTLDGRRFVLRLDWNARIGRWMLDLSTENGAAILRAKGLALRADLLRQVRYRTDAPPGVLMAIDTQAQDAEVSLGTLGLRTRHRLVYFGD